MKRYVKILGFLAVLAGLYVLTLTSIQRYLLFWPSHSYVSPTAAKLPQFKENILKMRDGTEVMTWYIEGDKQKPAILFFHGNAFQISRFAPHLLPFAKEGYGVLIMEYRNFGNTKGKTLQEDIFADAAETYDWLKEQGYPQIVVYGYSYGTAVASGLSSLREVEKMVLTAPFSSMRGLVAEKPVPLGSWVMRDSYSSKDYLQNYHNPLLIIHGHDDLLIPVHHGRIMYESAASADKQFIELEETDHRDIFFMEKNIPLITKWLQEH